MESSILKMQGIKKRFMATQALGGVDFEVLPGEVHILLGENGAGKSTLMKVLSGVHQSDEGKIYWKGEEVFITDPQASIAMGIGMVYQELSLVRELSVFENVWLGHMPKNAAGLIDYKKAITEAQQRMDEVGLDIDVKQPLWKYDLGVQQLIEIIRVTSRNASLVILDEPTSALTDTEVEKLFETIRRLKQTGVAFIYITHRLGEVFEIGDRVSVLRDGKTIGETRDVQNVTEDELVSTMVGREITDQYPKQVNITAEPFLTVEGFGDGKYFEDVTFTLHKGEVLGIAGLVGAGRSEMAEAIFGLRKYTKGKLSINGKTYMPKDPRHAIRNKIGFITKSRREGLLLHMPIYRNVTVSELKNFSTYGFRKAKKEIEAAEKYIEMLSVDASSVMANVETLSGGNQQKIAVAKWYCNHSEIFIMDDPTRGVDVGSKTEIYDMINEITKTGAAVLLISSDMPELLGISDNVLVMKRGRIAGQFKSSEATQEMVVEKAAGGD